MIHHHVREFKSTPPLYTVHDSTKERGALIVDEALPWVVRKGCRFPIIVGRYETEVEARCAAVALSHASLSLGS